MPRAAEVYGVWSGKENSSHLANAGESPYEASPAKPGAAAQVKRCIAEEAQDLRRRNAVLVTENAELQARVAMLERVVERSEGTGPLSAARDPGGKWYGYAYTREGARGPEAPAAAPAAGQRSEARPRRRMNK